MCMHPWFFSIGRLHLGHGFEFARILKAITIRVSSELQVLSFQKGHALAVYEIVNNTRQIILDCLEHSVIIHGSNSMIKKEILRNYNLNILWIKN